MISLALGLGVNMGGSSGFDPSQVFAGNAAGMWLDQSDITTGYQDSAGTTPQTASGQQTGLRLDKRLGLALGTNLIPVLADRTFSSDTGFWSKDPGVSISGGVCNFTAVALSNALFKAAGAKSGTFYEVTWTINSISAGSLKINGGGGVFGTARSAVGTYTERIMAVGASFGVYVASGPCTATVSLVSISPVQGNHVLQATGSTRPEWDVIGNISSDFTDGLDDGYSTANFVAGTLVAAMDFFITIKRATTASMVVASQAPTDGTRFLGAMDGSASAAFPGAGAAFTCFVDGVAVGTAGSCTRLQLGTALGSGAYHVLEVRDLDLSLWTQFTVGLYSSFMLNADMAQLVLCPSQPSIIRAKLRTYCGAKGGLSL